VTDRHAPAAWRHAARRVPEDGHAVVEWIARFMEHAEIAAGAARVGPVIFAAAARVSARVGRDFEAINGRLRPHPDAGQTTGTHPGLHGVFAITRARRACCHFIASALKSAGHAVAHLAVATERRRWSGAGLRQLMASRRRRRRDLRHGLHPACTPSRRRARRRCRQVRTLGQRAAPSARLPLLLGPGPTRSIEKGSSRRPSGQEGAAEDPPSDEAFPGCGPTRAIRHCPRPRGTASCRLRPVRHCRHHRRQQLIPWEATPMCASGAPLAAHRFCLRRRRRDAARTRAHSRRRGPGGFPRGESAQVALHAVRSQRLLLPPDRRPAPGVFSRADNLKDARRGPQTSWIRGAGSGRRFRSLKLWMILRYFGAKGVRDRAAYHIALRTNSPAGRCPSGLRTPRAGAVQRVCFRARPSPGVR